MLVSAPCVAARVGEQQLLLPALVEWVEAERDRLADLLVPTYWWQQPWPSSIGRWRTRSTACSRPSPHCAHRPRPLPSKGNDLAISPGIAELITHPGK